MLQVGIQKKKTKQQVKGVHESVMFFTPLFCKRWLLWKSLVDAPHNDLQFTKDILQYELTNQDISKIAFKIYSRQKWYLAPETIPLNLFCGVVNNAQKRAIADCSQLTSLVMLSLVLISQFSLKKSIQPQNQIIWLQKTHSFRIIVLLKILSMICRHQSHSAHS